MAKDEKAKLDKINEIKKADASVKSMADFTSPDVLYNELISSVLNIIRPRIQHIDYTYIY